MTQIADTKTSPVNVEERKTIDIRPGDTIRVSVRVEEKGKTRLQSFEGLVIARKHGSEPGATITVRRMSGDIGVERIFPLYSPLIEKIEIVKRSKVRRAKLYHIKKKAAREIKRQMRRIRELPEVAVMEGSEAPPEDAQKESEKQEESTAQTSQEQTEEPVEKEETKETPEEELAPNEEEEKKE